MPHLWHLQPVCFQVPQIIERCRHKYQTLSCCCANRFRHPGAILILFKICYHHVYTLWNAMIVIGDNFWQWRIYLAHEHITDLIAHDTASNPIRFVIKTLGNHKSLILFTRPPQASHQLISMKISACSACRPVCAVNWDLRQHKRPTSHGFPIRQHGQL